MRIQLSLWFVRLSLTETRTLKIYWLLLLLCSGLVVLFTRLGFWQLERSAEKSKLLQANQLMSEKSAIELTTQNYSWLSDYQPVQIEAKSINTMVVYMANESLSGQDGYHIYSAVEIPGIQKIVWINRGWVKALPDRRYLPEIEPVPSTWRIKGQAYYSKGEPLLFEKALIQISENQWLIQGRDYNLLSSILRERKNDALPYIIRLSPDAEYGFERQWEVVSMSPEKHTAYAVQWFALAIALVIVFFVVALKKEESHDGL